MTVRLPLLAMWERVQPKAGPSRPSYSIMLASSNSRPISVLGVHRFRSFSSCAKLQSGHNKWSKIRHKKADLDQEKSRAFMRISEQVAMCLRPPASTDPSTNTKLAELIAKAKDVGMPRTSVDKAIMRAERVNSGTGQALTMEVMGPSGKDAYIVECMTDNVRRTAANVRDIIKTNGGRVSPVSFLFERKGLIRVEALQPASFDSLFELVLDAGADDVIEVEGDEGPEWEVHTPLEMLSKVASTITSDPSNTFNVRSAEPAFIPSDAIDLNVEGADAPLEESQIDGAIKFINAAENDQDVVKVWTNLSGLQ